MHKYAHIGGNVSLKQLRLVSQICLIIAILSGIALLFVKYNPLFLFLTLWMFHCGFSYSVPPLRLKRFWWGGAVTYTFSTTVPFLTAALAFGITNFLILLISACVFWFGSLSGWTLTHISDRKFDRECDLETPAIRFGVRRCFWLHIVFLFASSFAGMIACVFYSRLYWTALPFLFTMVLSIITGKRVIEDANLEKIRFKAHTIGVSPYWLNITFLTIVYFFVSF
jgi:4-hydroxybenzoate polyprenyltransferase